VDVELATEEWRNHEDPMARFFADAGIVATGSRDDAIAVGELYETYRASCTSGGTMPKGKALFKDELERYADRLRQSGHRSFHYGRTNRGKCWFGLNRDHDGAADRVGNEPGECGTGSPTESPGNKQTPW
jgi:phage/plasmid-associated DNA primase